MKSYIILVLAILTASPVFAQKGDSKDADKSAPAQVTPVATEATDTVKASVAPAASDTVYTGADSLTQLTRTLTAKLNTVTKDMEKYRAVYDVIKEKVLKYDFDPARMSIIIDSLAAKRDSTFSALMHSACLEDSLIMLKKEHAQVRATLENYKTEDAIKTRLVAELKQLKELLDAHIITQSEFDIKKAIVLEKWH